MYCVNVGNRVSNTGKSDVDRRENRNCEIVEKDLKYFCRDKVIVKVKEIVIVIKLKIKMGI